jgi:carboxymethylenebutenolidase
VVERDIEIRTEDGSMTTFVVHPDDGHPHPVVLFLMDAPGKRPLLHVMARTIAERGYYVMLPNLYYRSTPAFELDFSSRESYARMSELMHGIGARMVERDAVAMLDAAGTDPAADPTVVGCVGYCMSGPFAICLAAGLGERVRAAASFYGARLVTDTKGSPHLRLGDISGELYVACAEHDEWVPLDMVDRFEAAMQASGVRGRLERYWGTHHGFAFSDRPAHDAAAEARHWRALFDLFDRNLPTTTRPGVG